MVGIGARVMLQNDYRVLTNLRGSIEAFYLATAGLEWSKNEISQAASFPPSPAARSENFGGGTFAVNFPTVAPNDSLSARIVVRSTGTAGTSVQTVEAQLRKSYDLADAAIGLRGNGAQVVFGGGAVLVSGRDHDPVTGKPISSAKPRAAVTADSDSLLGLINAAAGGLPPGSLENGASTPASITSDHLPAAAINQLASSLCGQAAAIVSAVPATGALTYENQTWGSGGSPELRCVDGLAESGDTVTLAGSVAGKGILIVRNADVIVTGQLRWEGLIIVSGAEVGFKVIGGGNKELIGGLILNETGAPGGKAILDIQSDLKVLFSRQALANTAPLLSTAVLNNVYTHLPTTIQQEYWRAVTP